MPVDLELAPKQKRAPGERCCEPVVYPDVQREDALRMAEVAKALGDPIRLQLVDVLRKHAGKVCVCELVPLFDISQPTLSHHLRSSATPGSWTPSDRAYGPTTTSYPKHSRSYPHGWADNDRHRHRRQGAQAMLRAEVEGLCAESGDRLPVHLHPAHRVGRAAASRKREERPEDRDAEHVQHELVVDRDRAEDVLRARAAGPSGSARRR